MIYRKNYINVYKANRSINMLYVSLVACGCNKKTNINKMILKKKEMLCFLLFFRFEYLIHIVDINR